MHRQLVICGLIMAFLAVALGAFAAHGLKPHLDAYQRAIWATAVDYQMYHALGLILVGVLGRSFQLNLNLPGWVMFAGIILFSGSLYALSLSGIKALGVITPLGGTCFLLAWGWLGVKVYRSV